MRVLFNTILAALFLSLFAAVSAPAFAADEDGYDLWLRYRPLENTAKLKLQTQARVIVVTFVNSPAMPLPKVRGRIGRPNENYCYRKVK